MRLLRSRKACNGKPSGNSVAYCCRVLFGCDACDLLENTVWGESLVGVFLEFGDFGVVELFLLGLKWLLEQKPHLEVFA